MQYINCEGRQHYFGEQNSYVMQLRLVNEADVWWSCIAVSLAVYLPLQKGLRLYYLVLLSISLSLLLDIKYFTNHLHSIYGAVKLTCPPALCVPS